MSTDTLNKFKHIRFLGAAGIGMSALINIIEEQKALGIAEKDLKISKSDLSYKKNDPITDDIDLVVLSTAIPETDPDLIALRELAQSKPELKFWHRSDMLNFLSEPFKQIVVTGTHGKTTCSAMLAYIMDQKASFAVGGILKNYETNGKANDAEYFVLEGDESDKSFTKTSPEIALITSAEPDHLENYPGGIDEIKKCFFDFLDRSPKKAICIDDASLAEYYNQLSSKAGILTYSATNKDADFYIDLSTKVLYIREDGETKEHKLDIAMHGEHNLINAAGSIAAATIAGLSAEASIERMKSFNGIKRRFELINDNYSCANANGITVYDDYAHHPTEVEALLKGALALLKEKSLKRLVFVYQPHHPERTKYLWDEFVETFKKFPKEHLALVADVYVARSAHIEGITSERLVSEINQPSVKYLKPKADEADIQGNFSDIAKALKPSIDAELQDGDLLFIVGAGNIVKLVPCFG